MNTKHLQLAMKRQGDMMICAAIAKELIILVFIDRLRSVRSLRGSS